jgi:hypothetical protein
MKTKTPPLAGDRLSWTEFERRTAGLPRRPKIELLDGGLESKAHTRFASELARRMKLQKKNGRRR